MASVLLIVKNLEDFQIKKVQDNKSFSDLEKLQYFVPTFNSPAASIWKTLKPGASNYPLIWKSLFNHYNDDKSWADTYIDKIFESKLLKSESLEGLIRVSYKFSMVIGVLKQLDSLSGGLYLFV